MTDPNGNEITEFKFNLARPLRQSNRLVEASYYLTLIEQKLMMVIISQIQLKERLVLSALPFTAISDAIGLSTDKYTKIRDTIKSLMRRLVILRNDDGTYYTTHWIQSMYYDPSSSMLVFKLDEDIQEDILELKSSYLQIKDMRPLLRYKSKYAARLDMLIRQYEKIKERILTFDEIRDMFELKNKYQQIHNLKAFVLEPAIEDILKAGDIAFRWEYIKTGRKHTGIRITDIKQNNSKGDSIPLDKQALYDRLIGDRWGISPARAAKIINSYGQVRIERNLKYAYENRKGKENNMGGWAVSCIEADHAGAQTEAQDAAKARAEAKQQAESAAAAAAIRAENAELGQNLFAEEPELDTAGTGHAEKLHALYAKLGKA